MPIAFKVVFTILLSVALALTLVVALSVLKLETFLRDVSRERASILVTDLSHALGGAYDVGLPLADFAPLAAVRHRAQQQSPDYLDMVLFDHQGVILQAADTTRQGRQVPASWQREQAAAGPEDWVLREGSTLIAGTALHSSFGTAVGGLAIEMSEETARQQVRDTLLHLSRAALLIFLAATSLAVPLGLLLSRRLRRLALAVEDAMAGRAAAAGVPNEVAPLVAAFDQRRRDAEAALASAENPDARTTGSAAG